MTPRLGEPGSVAASAAPRAVSSPHSHPRLCAAAAAAIATQRVEG
jgi:hypothetical protein